MKRLAISERDLLRYSLVFVWLATALTSLWELDGQDARILSSAGVFDRALQYGLVLSGVLTDAVLGVALYFRPTRRVFLFSLSAMIAMSLAATLLLPSLWLHPLGPLIKNVPIAAVLWVLAREQA
jgi:hypothetical protein